VGTKEQDVAARGGGKDYFMLRTKKEGICKGLTQKLQGVWPEWRPLRKVRKREKIGKLCRIKKAI